MTRVSSLIIATSFAILPMTAFAQQPNPAPAKPTTSAELAHPANSAETPMPGVKTQATTAKDGGTAHAKLTAKPAMPAKTAEPGKS